MTRRYTALQEFFLANFHPDWRLDHATRADIVREFARASDRDAPPRVSSDLADLLAEPLSERQLHEKILREYSLFYDPWRDEITMREWLQGLLVELRQVRDDITSQ